jgi:hypothetical protein
VFSYCWLDPLRAMAAMAAMMMSETANYQVIMFIPLLDDE